MNKKNASASSRRCRLRLSGQRSRCVGRCASTRESASRGLSTIPINIMPTMSACWYASSDVGVRNDTNGRPSGASLYSVRYTPSTTIVVLNMHAIDSSPSVKFWRATRVHAYRQTWKMSALTTTCVIVKSPNSAPLSPATYSAVLTMATKAVTPTANAT